ncbi:MAG: putative toxin-antitoxin system toxin component, PIN family [Deltaproteobacteria bacterium]|nr:putative toxin-antitoxin system toxin component, PIN family [Deltaproteobacteria bacterium]MBW1962349.1 putative toxin-antitoxin system toxin component, PIN family [Deltaproteobacteria bacterium]MBW2153482.1 putative toxin-antitoxin system toxin component, PIN family [Deltaproteobacteria bacterium]
MLKVVLDTNIFVSSVLSKTGRCATLIEAWHTGRYLLVTSPAITFEIKRVLESDGIRKKYHLVGNQIENLILLLEKYALVVPGISDTKGAVAEDPTDEMFLSAALDAKADLIVSGGHHLLNLREYRGIPVLTVEQFTELLENR